MTFQPLFIDIYTFNVTYLITQNLANSAFAPTAMAEMAMAMMTMMINPVLISAAVAVEVVEEEEEVLEMVVAE